MNKTSSYRQALIESLVDPVEAKNYLKAVLEDYPQGFLKALRNVAQANQMSKVAEAAGVKRESLYRALSEQGNPTLDTLTGVLSALGLKLSITSENADKPSAPVSSFKNNGKLRTAGSVLVQETKKGGVQ
ncbi:MAG: putative addiction module antidote protein [Acidobacteriota bacterium]|nr:putative addiction module antidote protein [Acidobacteriota bacterium]